jgi:hypothetical protein
MPISALSIQEHSSTSPDGVAFRFRAYRSSIDGKIVGKVETVFHPNSPAHIFVKTTRSDVDVQQVWLETLAIAHHYGVPLIEVDDPQGLFPDSGRC